MRTPTDGHSDETVPSGRSTKRRSTTKSIKGSPVADSPTPLNQRSRLGAFGEELVAGWYERSGFVIADRNWRTNRGELDLVVAKGPLLVFCEVKTRSSAAYGAAAEAVTPRKQMRVRLLAMRWLEAHPAIHPSEVRFDVAAITGTDVSIVVSAF